MVSEFSVTDVAEARVVIVLCAVVVFSIDIKFLSEYWLKCFCFFFVFLGGLYVDNAGGDTR